MTRAIIIHQWDGYPEAAWYPWLKKELEAQGWTVDVPAMPNPTEPLISLWVAALKDAVGTPDKDTYLIGHSIGGQTILRYLETLLPDQEVGGVVLVAPWMHLSGDAADDPIAKPWIETPITWSSVRAHCKEFCAIFSDDDPWVPLGDADIFRDNLYANIIIEYGKKHFSHEDNILQLPSVLSELLEMAK